MTWYGRGSRHERGYDYRWTLLRTQVLKRDGYLCQCQECKTKGRLRPAYEVDHVIPKAKGGSDNMANLAAINRTCHQRKTMQEQGRPMLERPRIGLDGWPIPGAYPGEPRTGGGR